MQVPRFLLWALTAGVVLFIGVKVFYSTKATFFWSPPGFQYTINPNESEIRIVKVMPNSSAAIAGIGENDLVVASDGESLTGFATFSEWLRDAQTTQSMSLTVRKPGGELRSYTIRMEKPFSTGFASAQFFSYVILLLIPLVCAGIGLTICWLRWEDPTARTGGLFFLSAPALFGLNTTLLPMGLRDFHLAFTALALGFAGYFCFAFFSEFPAPTAFAGRWRWVRRAYLAVSLVMLPFLFLSDILFYYSFDLAAKLNGATFGLLEKISGPFLLLGFLGSPLAALPGIRGELAADQRRRFGVLWFGIVAGCGPLLGLFLYSFIRFGAFEMKNFPRWVALTAVAMYIVFPLTFAYTIIKHRVLGIRQILRRSVQYAFLSRSYLLVEVVALFLLLKYPVTWTAQGIFVGMNFAPSDFVWRGMYYSLTGIGLFAMWSVNPHLQAMIDRAFFRDAYNAQHVLSELSRSVRKVANVEEVLQRVAAQINLALHVNRVAFLVKSQFLNRYASPDNPLLECFICRFELSSGGVFDIDLSLPESSYIVRRLTQDAKPLEVCFESPDSWVECLAKPTETGPGASLSERFFLETLDSRLLLPLVTQDNLVGFMSLGPKLSEEPFTDEDQQLLMAVAEATAFRLENSQLIRLATQEAEIKRELQIARRLQESLLPGEDPVIAGLEASGYSTAAHNVGGDYYDYFKLDESRLAFAVGDVTGHGVSSGLLMALAKGGLLNQVRADASPEAVMRAMNQLILTTGNKRNLMTFAYAVIDTDRRTLEIANAGHPFPYHFRADLGILSVLEKSAYPLGVRRETNYAPQTVSLNPGDVLVFFSDGIVEAQNEAGEVFGYETLEKIIRDNARETGAAQLRDLILDDVRAFTGPLGIGDDMTVIVLRLRDGE